MASGTQRVPGQRPPGHRSPTQPRPQGPPGTWISWAQGSCLQPLGTRDSCRCHPWDRNPGAPGPPRHLTQRPPQCPPWHRPPLPRVPSGNWQCGTARSAGPWDLLQSLKATAPATQGDLPHKAHRSPSGHHCPGNVKGNLRLLSCGKAIGTLSCLPVGYCWPYPRHSSGSRAPAQSAQPPVHPLEQAWPSQPHGQAHPRPQPNTSGHIKSPQPPVQPSSSHSLLHSHHRMHHQTLASAAGRVQG